MTPGGEPLLLDTCAAIWIDNGDPIATAAVGALDAADRARARTFISPMTAWEMGLLVAKGRISLPVRPEIWFSQLLMMGGITLAELSPDVLILSSFLPARAPTDPVDRIIAATARQYGYVVMTRDRALLDYADQGHIQAIAC